MTADAEAKRRTRELRLRRAQDRVEAAWARQEWWREFGRHVGLASRMAADAIDGEFRRRPWAYAYAAVLVSLWAGGTLVASRARRTGE